jgi:RNA polymerase nonessential primary-like sigma factor
LTRLNDRKKPQKSLAGKLTKPRGNWQREQPLWVELRKYITDAWTFYIYACSSAQRELGKVFPKKTGEGKSEKVLATVNAATKRKNRHPGKKTVKTAAHILTSHNSLSQLKTLCGQLPNSKTKEAALEATRRALGVRNKMLTRHQPLVVHTAAHLWKNEDCGDLEQDDLNQHGYTGLIVAIERFDPERGFRFTTFATWWIKASIRAAIKSEGRPIRLPHNVLTNMRLANRVVQKEQSEKGGQTKLEQASKKLGLTPSETDQVRLASSQSVLRRLDKPIQQKVSSDPGEVTLGDCIGCAPQHDEKLDHDKLRQILRKEIDALSTPNMTPSTEQRLRDVLLRRFGFKGDPQSLADIGRHYKISRERVRQLEVQGKRLLRRQLQRYGEVLHAMGYVWR